MELWHITSGGISQWSQRGDQADIYFRTVEGMILVKGSFEAYLKGECRILPRFLSTSGLALQSIVNYVLTRDIFLLAIYTHS